MGATRGVMLVRRLVNGAAQRPLIALVLLSSLLVPVGAAAASAPGNVTVSANAQGQYCVTWSEVSGANQYKIFDGDGTFLAVSGQANVAKCLPGQFTKCFMVSAMTNSGETAKSAVVCATSTAQTSSDPRILTAATTSVANCLPYPGFTYAIPGQPSIFCGQATQGQVVCGGGGGGGRDGRGTVGDGTINDYIGGDSQSNGGGGSRARDCDLDTGSINLQLPQIDYSTVASHDYPSLVDMILSIPAFQNLDPKTVDQVLGAVGCVAGAVGILLPPAKAISLTIAVARAKTDQDIAFLLTSAVGIFYPPAGLVATVHTCASVIVSMANN